MEIAAGAAVMGKQFLYHLGTNGKAIGLKKLNWEELSFLVKNTCQVILNAMLIEVGRSGS